MSRKILKAFQYSRTNKGFPFEPLQSMGPIEKTALMTTFEALCEVQENAYSKKSQQIGTLKDKYFGENLLQ